MMDCFSPLSANQKLKRMERVLGSVRQTAGIVERGSLTVWGTGGGAGTIHVGGGNGGPRSPGRRQMEGSLFRLICLFIDFAHPSQTSTV